MNANNARIAKNTGLLYVRMIFLTLVNFYAVRVTLEALGETDFGIYSIVASVVSSLSLLSGAMTSASQRFLSFHLGKEDYRNYNHTFTLLLLAFIGISAVLIIVGEVLDDLFIEHWLDIPKSRVTAAYWVYQASMVAFLFNFITIPYTSSIVANEQMGAFAGFSIVEGVLKLGIAIWLTHFGGDRLELYGVLTAAISIVVFAMSAHYCHARFKYFHYIWQWDAAIYRKLSSYTGWNLFGSISGMLANQGQAVLLNIYFGPIINTAKAIADRIQHVIQGFSINLYMAVSPQIIKSYATEDYQRTHNLVMKSSKLSFMLIYILSFPLICNMRGVLDIWLSAGQVTPTMVGFSQLILIYCLVITLEQPITRIIQATGEIKRYQLSVGIITLMYIPIAIGVLALGGSPVMTLVVQIAVLVVAQIVRVTVAHRQVNLSCQAYMKDVIYPILKVSLISIPVYLALDTGMKTGEWYALLPRLAMDALMGIFIATVIGLTPEERRWVWENLKKRVAIIRHKDSL